MKLYPFEAPDEKYRGLDLWMVNDKLEDGEIIKQIKEFKQKGFYSVIMRTYNGLISDYPDSGFKHSVRVAIDAARECGLKLALQAGFMPSAYPALPKEYALHRIVPVKTAELTENDSVLAVCGDVAFTDVVAPATVNMLDGASVDYYIQTAYEQMWNEFSDEFGKTVVSVWLDEPRFDNRYLTWTPCFEERFKDRYGYGIREHIPSLYYDIGDYKRVRYDYFTFIRQAMEESYYSKVRGWCHANGLSFAGHLMGEEFLTTQIAQSAAAMPFYKYFDIPGVDMLRSCHDWYDKPQLPVENRRRRIVERSMHVAAIQCTSAAGQAGKELKLCEMYGVTSPGFVFRDMMHMFGYFAANGINHQCMHALFYSPRGFRKRFYPQSFNVYQPFWDSFKAVKDYVASVSSFISMGSSGTDVAVLHPLETAYGLFRGLTDPDDDSVRCAVNDYDNTYYRLIAQLYSSQIGFHFADMPTVDSLGKICDGRFCVGKMSYGTLVIADIEVVTKKTLELITEFAKNGGRIYIKGGIPCRVDGMSDTSLKDTLTAFEGIRVFDGNEQLIRALDNDKRWRYTCDGDAAQTVINHRVDGNMNYFLVHNGDCRKQKHGSILLDGRHTACSFDGVTGKISRLYTTYSDNTTVIPFTNPVGGTTMIFTQAAQGDETCVPLSTCTLSLMPERVTTVVGGENVLTLEVCRYKTAGMDGFSDKELAIERVVEGLRQENYEGEVTLRFTFNSDFDARGLKLIVEDACECVIKLNGVEVSTAPHTHYYSPAFNTVTLPDAVRIGENTVDISRYTKPQVALKPSDNMTHLFELFRAPVGTDLERIHLLGDFSVDTVPEYSAASGLVRVSKKFFITPKRKLPPTSDITSHGYPFYPGNVEYTAAFTPTEQMLCANKVMLKLGSFNGCGATVFVNGRYAGGIYADPYTLCLDKGLFCAGRENIVRIVLCGTFRNMFGPSHFSESDPSGCNRWLWHYDFEHSEYTEYDTGSLTNSFQLVPYGIGVISLELY